jgi:hypothetical protein
MSGQIPGTNGKQLTPRAMLPLGALSTSWQFAEGQLDC